MQHHIINLIAVLAIATAAWAARKVAFDPADTVATVITVITRQVGQRAELRLKSGDKLTGKIETVGEKAGHLSALAGQEFFDAIVALEDISAVIIRTGGK